MEQKKAEDKKKVDEKKADDKKKVDETEGPQKRKRWMKRRHTKAGRRKKGG